MNEKTIKTNVIPRIIGFELQIPINLKKQKQFKEFSQVENKNKLKPGKIYTAKIIPLSSVKTGESCLALQHRYKNTILAGVQGENLLLNIDKDKLPKCVTIACFDEKEDLFKDSDNNLRVPCVVIRSDGKLIPYLGYFDGCWGEGYCLLLFFEKK